jgi:glucosamine--fructose-6-phosphate aminotransferase (isomerizing)
MPTHGDKNDINAHPHVDYKGRIALVHNGLIENCHVLIEELDSRYQLHTEGDSDSEVMAYLI